MQNMSTSRSTDFRRQKTITSKTPLTLYGRGFCASDRIPTTTGSPAGPQSNQNVWVLPPISRNGKRATWAAHLTNFSFEFIHAIFTEDASLLCLYHGAKKSKMTKNSNQAGVQQGLNPGRGVSKRRKIDKVTVNNIRKTCSMYDK